MGAVRIVGIVGYKLAPEGEMRVQATILHQRRGIVGAVGAVGYKLAPARKGVCKTPLHNIL